MTRLVDVLEIIRGEIFCVSDGQRKSFLSKEELLNSDLFKNYVVTSIFSENNAVVLELQPWQSPVTDMDTEWAKKYKEQNGSEPSFF